MNTLDDHLVGGAETNDEGLDLDAARARQRCFRLAAAGGVVAVADEHDPLLGLVGEERGRKAQRTTYVRRGRGRYGREAVEIFELGRQPLDERLAAERDHCGHVAVGPLLERLAHERESRFAAGRADTVGQVDDEDGRQPVDCPVDLKPGQRQHKRREDDGAQDERHSSPALAQMVPRGEAEADRDDEQQQADDEQLRPAYAERQVHAGLPGRPARRAANGLARLMLLAMRRAPSRS